MGRHLPSQVEHGPAMELERGPAVRVQVEVALIVRLHVPDRSLKHRGLAQEEQAAEAFSINLL